MKTILFSLVAFTIMLAFDSCSKKIAFGVSSIAPAAKASAKIKKDKNKNYAIDLSVMHLANPERLAPPRKYYVVWMVTERNGTKNIGQIKSSSSLISSTLKGSLKTVTSFRPAELFITAEDDANIQWPGSMVVLKSDAINIK